MDLFGQIARDIGRIPLLGSETDVEVAVVYFDLTPAAKRDLGDGDLEGQGATPTVPTGGSQTRHCGFEIPDTAAGLDEQIRRVVRRQRLDLATSTLEPTWILVGHHTVVRSHEHPDQSSGIADQMSHDMSSGPPLEQRRRGEIRRAERIEICEEALM
jgi:hypothetical protein